ncbi:SRPBCC domain-containing protein [Nostoc sp. NIES-2111]
MHTNTAKPQDLVITHVFSALSEEVWNAWTKEELLMQWWGGKGTTCTAAEMDVREGGTSALTSAHKGGTDHITWHYNHVTPLHRLEFTASRVDASGAKLDLEAAGYPADFPQDQRVVVTFKDFGEKETELFITQHGWAEGPSLNTAKAALQESLEKLATVLAE